MTRISFGKMLSAKIVYTYMYIYNVYIYNLNQSVIVYMRYDWQEIEERVRAKWLPSVVLFGNNVASTVLCKNMWNGSVTSCIF